MLLDAHGRNKGVKPKMGILILAADNEINSLALKLTEVDKLTADS
jgi:hypothetical protein